MTENRFPLIRMMGEDNLLVEFEAEVSREVSAKVRRLMSSLEQKRPDGYRMALPAYRSLLVYYDPLIVDDDRMRAGVRAALAEADEVNAAEGRLFRLPTVYGGEYGPDVARVAALAGISAQEVVNTAAKQKLPVYFLGFICSQAYLGEVPKTLQAPRHASPRPLMPGGSFGFGGPQANILAVDSPSGLNYVGRTFVKVFDPERTPPTAFRPGDFVQCPTVDVAAAREAGKRPMEDFIEPFFGR